MAVIHFLLSPWALLGAVAAVAAWYLYDYLVTYGDLRGIPAPFPAQFSNLWLLATCRRGRRYEVVDRMHAELGPLVRIQPNHVSVADDAAIGAIYGHGNGFLKADFYDAFVSIRRGLFNTRDRAEHTRKRKLVSNTFAPRSVLQFEPYIHQHLLTFVRRWDGLIEASPAEAGAGAGEEERRRKTAHVDCLKWFNYCAFDIIGDLAFGTPFGMLEAGADIAKIQHSRDGAATYAPAVEILNRRGEVSATLGCLPALKPWAAWLPDPFFSRGLEAVQNLAGIAIACVKERLDHPPDVRRKDLLSRLQEGRDDKGQPLGFEELAAEALTQLIAGSDTTSNSSTSLLYHVARTPGVLTRLQAELDAAIPPAAAGDDDDGEEGTVPPVPDYEAIRNLPYLEAVINETLRHHSTSGIGLPRQIPPGSPGVRLCGTYFPPGTVLSVPSYTMHHSREIWGEDADEFRPERWLAAGDDEDDEGKNKDDKSREESNSNSGGGGGGGMAGLTARQKNAFIPFSYGPRACVGRNVAEMEMKMIAATWARRYDVFLRQDVMETREGFLRKPLALEIGLRRRV